MTTEPDPRPPSPARSLMDRRRFLLTSSGALIGVGLAACTNDSGSKKPAPTTTGGGEAAPELTAPGSAGLIDEDGFQEAIVEVLVKKSLQALKRTGLRQLVVAGGVGANRQLRATLDDEARRKRFRVYYPELEFCTDNGAMISLAGCLRLQAGTPAKTAGDFAVQPRWPLMAAGAGTPVR